MRTAYKRKWRHSKGPEYAEKLNEINKAYQQTAMGKLALRAAASNTRAKLLGLGSKISAADLLDLWISQSGLSINSCPCSLCGKLSEWELDHIIEIADGGSHGIQNAQLVCRECHKDKSRTSKRARVEYTEQPSLFTGEAA